MLERVQEHSCTVGGNADGYSYCGEQYGGSLKNETYRYRLIQQSHFWHTSFKDKNSNLKRFMHFSVHSSTIYSSQDIETTQVSINTHLVSGVMQTMNETVLSSTLKNTLLYFCQVQCKFL